MKKQNHITRASGENGIFVFKNAQTPPKYNKNSKPFQLWVENQSRQWVYFLKFFDLVDKKSLFGHLKISPKIQNLQFWANFQVAKK